MAGPKIDEEYWFTFSETLIGKAQDRQEQAAEKLQNLVLWLWGIYTASAAVGFALAKKDIPLWPTLLIAAASASLIAVYWGTVWVRVPLLVEFDPRSPTEIEHAYAELIYARNRRLQITLVLSVVAAVAVTVSLVIASTIKESQPPGLTASIVSSRGNDAVAATARVGKTKEVRVDVRDQDGNSVTEGAGVYLPTDEGLLQVSLPIKGMHSDIVVVVEWEEATGTKWQLLRKLSLDRRPANPK